MTTEIPYTNLWTRETGTWTFDPDHKSYKDAAHLKTGGIWFVRLIDTATRHRIGLCRGASGQPRYSLAEAQADLANLQSRFPDAAGDFAVFKGPCIFSDAASHVRLS